MMKQLKFSMLALIVLMGISLSSCIKSDDNGGDYTRELLAQVRTGYVGTYFVDALGNQLFPTAASLLEIESKGFKPMQTHMAYIYYKVLKINTPTAATENTKRTIDIELLGAISMDGDALITEEGSGDDVPATAPIIGAEFENGMTRLAPFAFDEHTIVLPLFWRGGSDKESFAQHKFTLVFHPEKVQKDATEMVLQLRHDKGTDTKSEARTWVWRCYNINDMLLEFISRAGVEKPAKITIETVESDSSIDINHASCKKNSYSIVFNK